MKLLYKALVLAASIFAFSQTTSAQIYAGGSLALAGVFQESDYFSAFSIAPEAGFLYNDNWAFGGRLAIVHTSSAISDEPAPVSTISPISSISSDSHTIYAIAPYAAYKALTYGNFSLWADGSLSIVPSQNSVDGVVGISIMPVLTYSFSDHFLFRTGLNFAGFSLYRNFDRDTTAFSIAADADNLINVGNITIGAVYRF